MSKKWKLRSIMLVTDLLLWGTGLAAVFLGCTGHTWGSVWLFELCVTSGVLGVTAYLRAWHREPMEPWQFEEGR